MHFTMATRVLEASIFVSNKSRKVCTPLPNHKKYALQQKHPFEGFKHVKPIQPLLLRAAGPVKASFLNICTPLTIFFQRQKMSIECPRFLQFRPDLEPSPDFTYL